MAAQESSKETSLEFMPNGPLLVKGEFLLREAGGQFAKKTGPVALCRCGHSGKKPYCDGSHKAADFKAD